MLPTEMNLTGLLVLATDNFTAEQLTLLWLPIMVHELET
jgi:hypothetical protein